MIETAFEVLRRQVLRWTGYRAYMYARVCPCIFTTYSVRIVIFTEDGNECNERVFCKYLGPPG